MGLGKEPATSNSYFLICGQTSFTYPALFGFCILMLCIMQDKLHSNCYKYMEYNLGSLIDTLFYSNGIFNSLLL